jgi:serine/threonine protein kinase
VLARRDAGGIAVRIIDFGMSSVAVAGRGVGGTPAFMAPELLAVSDDDDDEYVRVGVWHVVCMCGDVAAVWVLLVCRVMMQPYHTHAVRR